MQDHKLSGSKPSKSLEKVPTGIKGFDELTNGGLPKNRLTLLSGEAGNAKSLFGVQFLVNGIEQYNEPGLLVSFEVSKDEIIKDFASLKFNLDKHIKNKKLVIDSILIDRSDHVETGIFDLEGLFLRIGYCIDKYKIKRIVLDTIEVIFGAITNESFIRSELHRLFNWLKHKGVTAIITAERGATNSALTRF